MLSSAPILVYPDYNKTFYLYTDASDLALGVILAQLNSSGLDHPIAYYSKIFTKAEKNYSVSEKECLAVLLGIKHFRHFLYGTHFKVVTDHSSLQWLIKMKDPEKKLSRWAVKLQNYDFEVIYQPGLTHLNVDGLNRLPICFLNLEMMEDVYDQIVFQYKSNQFSSSQLKKIAKLS